MSNELIWMSNATKAIAKVSTAGGAKQIADRAAAIKLFARKQKWSVEQRAEISEIEIQAVARMGELLKEATVINGYRDLGVSGSRKSLPDLITKNQSSRAQKVASVPVRLRAKYIAENKPSGSLSVTGLVRMAREIAREKKRQDDRKLVESADDPTEINGVVLVAIHNQVCRQQ